MGCQFAIGADHQWEETQDYFDRLATKVDSSIHDDFCVEIDNCDESLSE